MDIDFIIQQALKGVLLPAAISGIIFLFFNRWAPSQLKPFGAVAAVAAGFIAGYLGVQTYVYPPVSLSQWLPHVALVAAVWGVLECSLKIPRIAVHALRLAAFAYVLYELFETRLRHRSPRVRWSTDEAILNFLYPLLIFLVVGFIFDWLLRKNAEAESREVAILPSALVLGSSLAAVSIVLSGSGIIAQIIGVFTAAVGAVMLLAWLLPNAKLNVSASPLITSLLTMLVWLGGHFYASLPLNSALILMLSPAFLAIPLKLKLWQNTLVYLALIGLSNGLAVVIAYQSSLSRYGS